MQGCFHPSLVKVFKLFLNPSSFEGIEIGDKRKRKMKITKEDGLMIEETIILSYIIIKNNFYFSLSNSSVLQHKHYSTKEIQDFLLGNDYSLASERTKRYWKAWYKAIIYLIILNLMNILHTGSKKAEEALWKIIDRTQEVWLHTLLNLFLFLGYVFCRLVDCYCCIFPMKGPKVPKGGNYGRVPDG